MAFYLNERIRGSFPVDVQCTKREYPIPELAWLYHVMKVLELMIPSVYEKIQIFSKFIEH